MANDFLITQGAGTTIAADDAAGVYYQKIKIADGAADGTAMVGADAANGLDVDVTRILPGVTATALGKAEDAAHANGDVGVEVLAVRTDAPATLAAHDNDYAPLQVDAQGNLRVAAKGNGFDVQVDITVDAGAYSIGDALGVTATFAAVVSAVGKRSVINSITLTPNAAMPAIPFNLWLLNADLVTPIAKNAAFTMVAADAPKILATIPIVAVDYIPTQDSWNVAHLRGVGCQFKAGAATTSVYVYLVATAVTAPVATHVFLTLSGEFID